MIKIVYWGRLLMIMVITEKAVSLPIIPPLRNTNSDPPTVGTLIATDCPHINHRQRQDYCNTISAFTVTKLESTFDHFIYVVKVVAIEMRWWLLIVLQFE